MTPGMGKAPDRQVQTQSYHGVKCGRSASPDRETRQQGCAYGRSLPTRWRVHRFMIRASS